MHKGFPGHKDFPTLGVPNDCMRNTFCCVTGLNPVQVPFVDPLGEGTAGWFFEEWNANARALGFHLEHTIMGNFKPLSAAELWIAVVPGLNAPKTHHAVAMQGSRLYWDCCSLNPEKNKVRQRVRLIHRAIRVRSCG